MKTGEIRAEYERRYPVLRGMSGRLSTHLAELLTDVPRVDSVSARAKSPDRFEKKALKNNEDGTKKYADPISEIQDQIGARITVFYLADVKTIEERIVRYFKFIEQQEKAPISDAEFGYFGLHFVLQIPEDVVPDEVDPDEIPQFFELQIKTLFQHAWSEAHHDLGYKSMRDLTSDEQRKVAFTAAQAWGADTIFEDLARKLVFNDNEPPDTQSDGDQNL